MANALPFDVLLDTVVIPQQVEIAASLFGSSTCTFTVVNFRNGQRHEIEVRMASADHTKFSDTLEFSDEVVLQGVIVKVDGKDWGRPYDDCTVFWCISDPARTTFKIFDGSADPLPSW